MRSKFKLSEKEKLNDTQHANVNRNIHLLKQLSESMTHLSSAFSPPFKFEIRPNIDFYYLESYKIYWNCKEKEILCCWKYIDIYIFV